MTKLKETRMQKYKELREKLGDDKLKYKSELFNSLLEPLENVKEELEENKDNK